MDYAKIMGIARHALGAIGAFLVGLGYAESDSVTNLVTSIETIVGAVGVVAATVASVYAKIKGE